MDSTILSHNKKMKSGKRGSIFAVPYARYRFFYLSKISIAEGVLTHPPPMITLFCCARQTVGSHPEIGRFWISKDYPYNDEFSAFVDTKEFVRGFYLSLMTELGLNH